MTPVSLASDHCITCSDDGTPMTVLEVDGAQRLARCRQDASQVDAQVEIALVEPVLPGDRLLVHAGTAIFRLASDATAA